MARETAAEIQLQLDDVNLAIKRVTTGGQEYKLDTGQTQQFNKRANLKELMILKKSIQSDLQLAEKREGGGNVSRGVFC